MSLLFLGAGDGVVYALFAFQWRMAGAAATTCRDENKSSFSFLFVSFLASEVTIQG